MAPEVLAVSMYDNVPGYRMEVDMWACGVIMYTLLCGAPPFWHRKQMQMLRMIMQANYAFGSPEWDDVSQSAKDLVRHIYTIIQSTVLYVTSTILILLTIKYSNNAGLCSRSYQLT